VVISNPPLSHRAAARRVRARGLGVIVLPFPNMVGT
jgi:hypothetical protein